MIPPPANPAERIRARRRRIALRVGGLVVLGLGVGALWQAGLFQGLTTEGIQARVAEAGPMGPLVYVLAFACLQPFGLSAHLFLVAAGLMWESAVGIPLGLLGMMLGCTNSFAAARWMGREAVQARIPAGLAKHDDALARRGLRTVIALRVAFFTFFPVSMAMGVSQVSWRDYMLGTFLGCLPMALFDLLAAHHIAAGLLD
jgi:uncharacterized membrane protein YdjX (TVP38/TMEM64 family)